MPEAVVQWGVIGCGGIAARRTIPEFAQAAGAAELVSVMDVDASRAAEVAERFGVPHHCTSEEELLKRPLDAVYIASPPAAHCRQVLQSAAAGKHILCEKPMALTLEEADQMARGCRSAGVQFMLGFCMRNNIYHRQARQLLEKGSLGRMVMARAQLTCWYPPIPGAWRQDVTLSGGGALIDMGTHCLDLLEWLMDSRITHVAAFEDQLVQKYPTAVEDTSTVLVRLANGAHGVINNYFNLPDAAAQNTLELHGTGGCLIAQGTIGQEPGGTMFSILQGQAGYDAAQTRSDAATRRDYQLSGRGLYGQMIEQFSRCILHDEPSPVSLADGRHSIQLVQAIYQSAREGRTIEVTN